MRGKFYHDMYYEVICMDAGLLCGVLVGLIVLSFCPVIMGANHVLVVVEGICYILQWRG